MLFLRDCNFPRPPKHRAGRNEKDNTGSPPAVESTFGGQGFPLGPQRIYLPHNFSKHETENTRAMQRPLSLPFSFALSVSLALLISCSSSGFHGTVVPNALIITSDDDTLRARILHATVLTTTVLTEQADTLAIENDQVEQILSLPGREDATAQFIDREKIRVELAKRVVLEKRERLREDVKAGLRKKADLNKAPVALLATILRLPERQPPRVEVTVFNLSSKKILTFRAKVYCMDARGAAVFSGTSGRSSFEAVSRFPINPDDEFSTALVLRAFPATRKVRVEIVAVQFADKTSWQGRIQEMSL
jgi:hypothetical protein